MHAVVDRPPLGCTWLRFFERPRACARTVPDKDFEVAVDRPRLQQDLADALALGRGTAACRGAVEGLQGPGAEMLPNGVPWQEQRRRCRAARIEAWQCQYRGILQGATLGHGERTQGVPGQARSSRGFLH